MNRGMLAFVTGLGGGYMTAQERKRQRDEHEEDRAWKREQRDRERQQQQRDDTLRTDLQEAGKPVKAQDASTYQPTVDDEGNAMPANPTAGRMSVAGQMVQPEQVDAAVAAANTPMARSERMAGAYEKAGMADKAQSVRTGALQADTAVIQARQMREADERDTKLREVGSLIARGGWGAVPKVYERYNDGHTAEVTEDGKGGAIVVTKDKGGKVVARDTYTDLPQLFGRVAGQFDPKLWLGAEKEAKKEAREVAKDASEARYKDRMASVAERNADTNESYRRDMANAAVTRAEASAMGVGKSNVERMSEADKLTYQGLNKRIEKLDEELMKAELGGMADPAALQTYKSQRAALQLQAGALARKYGEAPAADPAGVRKGGAPAAGGDGAKVDPAEQRKRDADRIPILEAELRNANTPEDRAALEREIARVRGQAGAPRMVPTMARPAAANGAGAAAAPAAVPPPAAMSAPMAGGAAQPTPAAAQPAQPQAATPPFQQFLAENIAAPGGKVRIAKKINDELALVQQGLISNAQLAQNQSLPPVARQAAAAKAEALGVQLSQMQAFMQGNPSFFQN